MPDFVETKDGTDPNDATSYQDTDGDGVPNYVRRNRRHYHTEVRPATRTAMAKGTRQCRRPERHTTPTSATDYADSDGDGVPNSVETKDGTDPNLATSFRDTDGDGLANFVDSDDDRRLASAPSAKTSTAMATRPTTTATMMAFPTISTPTR